MRKLISIFFLVFQTVNLQAFSIQWCNIYGGQKILMADLGFSHKGEWRKIMDYYIFESYHKYEYCKKGSVGGEASLHKMPATISFSQNSGEVASAHLCGMSASGFDFHVHEDNGISSFQYTDRMGGHHCSYPGDEPTSLLDSIKKAVGSLNLFSSMVWLNPPAGFNKKNIHVANEVGAQNVVVTANKVETVFLAEDGGDYVVYPSNKNVDDLLIYKLPEGLAFGSCFMDRTRLNLITTETTKVFDDDVL